MKRRAELLGSLVLIILGIGLTAFTLVSSSFSEEQGTLQVVAGGYAPIHYPSNSQVIISLNTTSPISVAGLPSGATSENNSIFYVFCFFSSQQGNVTIHNQGNQSSLIYYEVQYSHSSSVVKEYTFVGGIISMAIGALVLIMYFARRR